MKTVFITGATSGIGRACAIKFAQNGNKLVINGRNEEKLHELKEEIQKEYKVDVHILLFDVRDYELAKLSISTLPIEFKSIDILVNNAGLVIGVEKEFNANVDDWNTMIDTNIKGILSITSLIVPSMVERNCGHIINIGSIAGDVAYPGGSIYCATKAAVKALTDGLRIDLVDTSLRVTNVKPGLVETNFSVTRFRGDKQSADNVYKGLKPLSGSDIAEVVYWASTIPEYMQIAEVLVMPTAQATGTIVHRG